MLEEKMKRLTIVVIITLLMTACYAYSAPEQEPIQPKLHQQMTYSLKHKSIPRWSLVEPLTDLSLQAKAAFFINSVTGDILFDKNADESLPIASMSKIMTELLVLEAIEAGELNWEDTVTISEYAYTISNQPGRSEERRVGKEWTNGI